MWFGYVFFVIYGSLVPLKYKARPLSDAWFAFQNIPFLRLGVESRADWIANGVLYVPVAFLTTYLLIQSFRRAPYIFLFTLAAVFSFALAVAVEFLQLFFPARTVSLNDILAEWVGSVVGLALFARYANWFGALLKSFVNDPQRLKVLILDGYVFAYLAFALFPYDFVLSRPELSAKLDSSNWGWLIAGSSSRPILAGLQLAVEVVMTIPFGVLLARRMGSGRANCLLIAVTGLLLGCCIEVAQLFIASGVSQGLSVLTRALGVCIGVAISRYGDRWTLDHISSALRRYTPALTLVYLTALLEINGWLTIRWHGLHVAMTQLAAVHFMPFYYHYFRTEAMALFSLAVVSVSYTPVGLLAWARAHSPGYAATLSIFAAVCIEGGKLFIQRSHPDPTNILLAAIAGWSTVWLMRQLSARLHLPVESRAQERKSAHSVLPGKTLSLVLLACLVATGVWVVTFPAFPAVVGLLLISSAVTVWYRPVWLFAIIPAALPVLDLAPWSGRFFFDEFDALLLVGLAVACSRVSALPGNRFRPDALRAIAIGLVALSFSVSAVVGLLPFALPDANAFNNYYSPYNSLRIVKGALWAASLVGLAQRFAARGIEAHRPFCWGMVAGLGLTVAVILWERVAFSGLWNFTGAYRVTGSFSAMHIGGAYIECFLAVATPFLLLVMAEKRNWFVRLGGMALLLATTYTLMVTFSRNGYFAFAVGILVALTFLVFKSKRQIRSGVISAGLAFALLLVAIPIFNSEFAQARMATLNADLAIRQAHWEDALTIRDSDVSTTLFGMGLGQYPVTNYWRGSQIARSGTYQLENETGNTYLRLGSGDSIYVEQLVSVEAGKEYVLKLEARSSVPNALITVPICEKWMLTSYNCVWQSFELGKQFGTWRTLEKHIKASELSISPWYSKRPIKFALYYGVPNSTIDIDNVRLETASGAALLRNGDFSSGLDHWFFSSDGHLQWHIKSMFYGLLFDQGWFGLVAVCLLLALALARAARSAIHGNIAAGASLAALTSFLIVGFFDTLIDSPRFLLLLFMLAWACISHVVPTTRHAELGK